MIPVVLIRGRSGSGKTTLVLRLIRWLTGRGFRVGAAKHAHDAVEFDHPGKDSHTMRVAGAAQVLVAGRGQAALFFPADPSVWTALDIQYQFVGVDLILVEGFRTLEGEAVLTVEGPVVRSSTGVSFDRDDVSGIARYVLLMTGLGGGLR